MNGRFAEWVEIFRGGTQTDSAGREHDGDDLIDKALALFDPGYHEPPVVLGHPEDDAPAYGWVEALRKVTRGGVAVLEAKFKDIADELREWLAAGRYKKRSASFYPDGRLRHVGFLGAAPPAVKGLAPVPTGFSAEDAAAFEFSEGWKMGVVAQVFRALREWLIEKEGAAAADRVVADYEIQELMAPDPELKDATQASYTEPKKEEVMTEKQFTEADLQAARDKAAQEAAAQTEERLRAEFAEAERTRERKAAQVEIAAFVDAGISGGTLAPAWKAAGIGAFMETLAGLSPTEFSDGKTETPLAWFKAFLSGLPQLVDFSEIATRDKTAGAEESLDALARAKMKADENLHYSDALRAARAERPDLFDAWLQVETA